MKKITLCIMVAGLLISFQPLNAKAETNLPGPTTIVENTDNGITEADETALLVRLNEINDMDHSQLKFKEKKALRKEVKAIQNQLENPNGVYISVGGAILIIILLIILL